MKLHDNSTVTFSILLPIVLALLGGAGWATMLYFQTDANAKAITEIQTKQESFESIRTDIAVIKTELKILNKKMDQFQ